MGTPLRRIDCHQHAWELETLANVATNAAQIDCAAVNLVSCIDQKQANANPPAFVAKALFPEQVYVFAGLDHSAYFSEGRLETPSLAEQIDRLLALGADGIKMLENKPTARKMLDIPVDSPYFAEYFAHAEETGVPILWHVADPEEFWRPETTPVWARERGWGYNDTFVAKEQLYAEVENVLTRHLTCGSSSPTSISCRPTPIVPPVCSTASPGYTLTSPPASSCSTTSRATQTPAAASSSGTKTASCSAPTLAATSPPLRRRCGPGSSPAGWRRAKSTACRTGPLPSRPAGGWRDARPGAARTRWRRSTATLHAAGWPRPKR